MKKLKKAAQRVAMPDELKKRILHEAEVLTVSENEGYKDSQVFTVEKAKPNHITHIISAVAACAVLVVGIGFAGIDRSRDNMSPESLSDVSCEAPPFGDITQHEIAEIMKSRAPMELTSEQIQNIAELFSGQSWEEIELTENQTVIDGVIWVSDERWNIQYWFDFTDSTEENCNEGFYICAENMLCHIAPDGEHFYGIDYEFYDTELRRILGYPEKVAPEDIKLEFTEVSIQNVNRTDDYISELTDFFNEQTYIPADVSVEEAGEPGAAFTLVGWGNDWDYGQYMFLYRSGYLQFSVEPELTRMYKVDYELFNQTIGDIASENGGATGADAPFGEFVQPWFGVTSLDGEVILYHNPENSPELQNYLTHIYWESAEPADNFGENGNGFIIDETLHSSKASLAIDFDLKLAKYSKIGDTGTFDETFYKINLQDFYYVLYRWCFTPRHDTPTSAPFSAFIHQQEEMYCYGDLDKINLDENKFQLYCQKSELAENDNHIYAILLKEHIKAVVDVLESGWDWTDCVIAPYQSSEERPIFSFIAKNDDRANEISNMLIYEDGTVNIQFYDGQGYISFRNVDGGTGELYKAIEKALQEIE